MTLWVGILGILEGSRYFLIFLGCFFEGSTVMMATGVLLKVGAVSLWPAYGSLFLADVLSDACWYFVGYYGGRRFVGRWGHLVNATPEVMEKVERRFKRHHATILIVSKLTMGFGLAVATLMTAGMMRVPFRRYFAINFFGGIIWVFGLMMVGYAFGDVLSLIPRLYQILFTLAILVGFFFGLRYASERLAQSDW